MSRNLLISLTLALAVSGTAAWATAVAGSTSQVPVESRQNQDQITFRAEPLRCRERLSPQPRARGPGRRCLRKHNEENDQDRGASAYCTEAPEQSPERGSRHEHDWHKNKHGRRHDGSTQIEAILGHPNDNAACKQHRNPEGANEDRPIKNKCERTSPIELIPQTAANCKKQADGDNPTEVFKLQRQQMHLISVTH